MTAAATTAPGAGGWHAELALGFETRGGRTVLANRHHAGPLLVQRPFYPEGDAPCHVYLLHPPAGLVGGDELRLEATVPGGASALITTPAATRFYRSAGDTATVRQRLHVAAGAALEWLPQESIVFDGARAALTTEVSLQRGARFIGWEMICLGRPVSGETFGRGHCDFRLEVQRDGAPVSMERLCVAGGDPLLAAAAGLHDQPICATLVATVGHPDALAAVREIVRDGTGWLGGATIVDSLLICRVLGTDAQAVKRRLVAIWEVLRPRLTGRAPCPPRIWRT